MLRTSAQAPNRRHIVSGRMIIRAFLFPGQGSQSVGMGRGLADASPIARAVFEEVDELKRLSRGHRISDDTIHDMQRDHCGSR